LLLQYTSQQFGRLDLLLAVQPVEIQIRLLLMPQPEIRAKRMGIARVQAESRAESARPYLTSRSSEPWLANQASPTRSISAAQAAFICPGDFLLPENGAMR
jgi:hypothetical protein